MSLTRSSRLMLVLLGAAVLAPLAVRLTAADDKPAVAPSPSPKPTDAAPLVGRTEGRAKITGNAPAQCPKGQAWTQTEERDGCAPATCTAAQNAAITALRARYNTGHPGCAAFVQAWPPCRKIDCAAPSK